MNKNTLLYGGLAALAGLVVIYFVRKQAPAANPASTPDVSAAGISTPIANTASFGAGVQEYTGSGWESVPANAYGGLGEPVSDYGSPANTALATTPPPATPTILLPPPRRRCGCCPDDTPQANPTGYVPGPSFAALPVITSYGGY